MKTETIPYKGYEIQINYDEYPWNPRNNENECIIYSCSKRMPGDQHGRIRERILLNYLEIPEGYTKHLIYYHSHSRTSIRLTPFTDPWDSGLAGCIVRPPNVPIENMEAEVEMYNHYLRGECYEYVILKDHGTCFNCKQPHVEEIDRASGFIGDQAYCIAEAKAHIDVLINSLELLKETK